MRRLGPVALLALVGCDRVFDLESVGGEPRVSDAAEIDPDGSLVDAPESTGFTTPVQVYELSSANTEDDPTVTDDGKEIYFNSYRAAGAVGGADIWRSTRTTVTSMWSAPTNITALNTTGDDNTPRITGDGTTMYMSRNPTATREIMLTTRPNRSLENWATPKLVAELNSADDDTEAVITADELSIYFASNRAGTTDIYVATRTSVANGWTPPKLVEGLNTSTYDEESPYTRDGKTLYFSSNRPGSKGNTNIWRATRMDNSGVFSAPEPVDELNSDEREEDPWLSPDGKTIWFASSRNLGVFHLFTATR
jgi:Tol biopolymer transport system component